MMRFMGKALGILRPGKPICYNSGEPIDASKIIYESECDPITQQELEAKISELEEEYEAQQYARDRATSYPSVGDQLDMLMKDMKNGTTTHQESCETVKAKYPKP